jgi:5-methyltetrahydropteroyltriglutamate--homocysteine methyltransferase
MVFSLIPMKDTDMESVDDLTRRIDHASKVLLLHQLALSPHCGFGGIDSKVLSEDAMWRKLDMIV